MNKEKPLWGVDVSNHQGAVDHKRIKVEGFDFLIAKASQGTYFKDKWCRHNLQEAKKAGLVAGAYHYLEHGEIRKQVDLFLGMIGGVKAAEGMILVVDVELSGWGNDPDVHDTWNFIHELKARLNNEHPILIYSGAWYWKDPRFMRAPNPDVTDLVRDFDVRLWLSEYVHPDYLPQPPYASSIYQRVPMVWWDEAFGNHPPVMLQFTDRALVAGQYIDANAFAGSRANLVDLTTGVPRIKKPAPAPEKPVEKHRIVIHGFDDRKVAENIAEMIRNSKIVPEDKVMEVMPRKKPPEKIEGEMSKNLKKVNEFSEKIKGTFYATWHPGTDHIDAPIYFDKLPSVQYIRQNGTICSGYIVLLMHLLGADLSVLQRPGVLPGGTLSMGQAWGHLEQWEQGKVYPPLTIFGTPYEGDINRDGNVTVDEQGHVAVGREEGSDPLLWQSIPVGGVRKDLRVSETFRPRYVVRPFGRNGWIKRT